MKKEYIKPNQDVYEFSPQEILAESFSTTLTTDSGNPLDGKDNSSSGGTDNSVWARQQGGSSNLWDNEW